MNYPNLPDKMSAPLYTGKEMQHYAEAAVDIYKSTTPSCRYDIDSMIADIKVKDSTIRTLQVELLKYRNKPVVSYDSSELITLRRKVAELEERCRNYSWATDKTQWGA
jgi:hypothetical protein